MIRVWIFVLSLYSSSAVIYHLNDTEYHRMPPLFALDEYDLCLIEEGSTYCMVQLNLYAEPENELMRMITEYSDQRLKHYNHTIIDRGVCVKKSCHKYISNTTKDLPHQLEACLNDSLSREYGLSARVSALYYCDHHKEPRPIDALDWTVLIVIFGLVIINIVGSVYDYFVSKHLENNLENGNDLILSFSVMHNWQRLTNTDTCDPKIQELRFFHGARVISNLFTLLLHAIITFLIGYLRNPHDLEKTFDMPMYQLIFDGMNLVQVFFFITGFLTVYRLQIEEQNRPITVWDVPKLVLLRFSRLVPVLAISLALSATWIRHVGSGPLWKMFVTGSLVADCRNYWWRHLFFINNYSDESKFCIIPTWQLAAEVQVFLVGLTAYAVTRGRTRRVVLGVMFLLSAAAPAVHTVLQDLDATIVIPQHSRTFNGGTFWLQHVLGHTNLPCFIMGMVTASRIYDWQKKGGHLVKKWWHSVVQYSAVAAIPLISYSGRVFFSDGLQAPVLARAMYSTTVRLLVGLACACAVPTLLSRTPTYLKLVFEWQGWVVPSRLTYCVFMLHMMLAHIIMGAKMQLSYFSFSNVMTVFFIIVVVTYLISVPVYLMVEAPFSNFFKNLMKKHALGNTSDKNEASIVNDTSVVNGVTDVNGKFALNGTSLIHGTAVVNGKLASKGTFIDRKVLNATEAREKKHL